MAQLNPIQRGNYQSSKSPKSQNSPTFEQLLHDDSPNWNHSMLAKNQDQEECSSPQSKKSVLTKVKEKAKKLKHTLSGKKKNDGGSTPTCSVGFDDEEEMDEDAEYLGAPMYESELAPETYRENARQHPRANPVVPENHIAPSCVRHENEEEKHGAGNKTITEAVTERLAPAYAAVSDATTTMASKVASLTVRKPKDQQNYPAPSAAESDTEYSAAASDFEDSDRSLESEEEGTRRPKKLDRCISVKEYFMNKLEPGEDERALSQFISDAISPKKGADSKSVAGKVCAAVTTLLQVEEPSVSTTKKINTSKTANLSTLATPKLLRQKSLRSTGGTLSAKNPMKNRVSFYPPIPISTNAREVDEDENYGRILQAN